MQEIKTDEQGSKVKDYTGSWSTPVVGKVDGREQVVVSWPGAVKGHDLKTGEVLWSCTGLAKDKDADRLVYTSPLVTPEVVVAMSGFHGSALAVRTGGKGDVTQSHRLWHDAGKNPQRIGSGVILGDYLYMINAGPGTVQCIDLRTGKDRWGGKRLGTAFWGSLVLADGKFYATDQEGDTYVFRAAPEFELLARNRLGEHTNASPALSDGAIFIRTHERLWCIGTGKK